MATIQVPPFKASSKQASVFANELNNMDDVDGHLIEEKRRQKMLDQEIEDDEYSYVQGEDDDIDDF